MKLIALLGAGVLAAGSMAALPAEAQRYGYGHHGWDRGHHGGYRDRGYRRGYYGRSYYGHGYDRGRGYYGPRGYRGRPRVVCRVQRGYYGPVRRCFRPY